MGGFHLPLDLIDNIEQWRVHSLLWQFCPVGGQSAFGIYMFIYALVFPYIFLLFDCFKWALIGDIEQQRVDSVLWQFQMGGPSAFGIYMFLYALVFPYIFLLVDCFEWALIDHI